MVFTFILFVYFAFMGVLSKKNPQKASGVIVVCSALERITNSLKIRKMAGYMKHWKVKKFLRFRPSLAHDKWDNVWLTSFKSRIRPWKLNQKSHKQLYKFNTILVKVIEDLSIKSEFFLSCVVKYSVMKYSLKYCGWNHLFQYKI